MKGVRRFSTYLRDQLKNKEFRRAFEKEGIYADLAIQIARLRQGQGYSQKDIARFLGTTQQTISRLEDPHNNSLSVNTLIRLAIFFKKSLKIHFA